MQSLDVPAKRPLTWHWVQSAARWRPRSSKTRLWSNWAPAQVVAPSPWHAMQFVENPASAPERYDQLVGELLAELGPGDHLAVLSDHGFEWSGSPEAPSGQHETRESADAASIVLFGPRIEPGADLGEVPLLDVLPTLLALADLPASERMPGRVAVAAFRAGAFAPHQRVAAYHRLNAMGPQPPETEADAETIERLRTLGYIE